MNENLQRTELERMLDELNALIKDSERRKGISPDSVREWKTQAVKLLELLSVMEYLAVNADLTGPAVYSGKTEPPSEQASSTIFRNSIGDLKTVIGLNDRFRFVNELFGGNSNEFNTAINQLNGINSMEDAEDYLDRLEELYNWDKSGKTFEDFYSLIKRKLG
jgi:hypothetical protein